MKTWASRQCLQYCREDVKIDVFDWSEDEDSVRARWRFSSVLNVPWRPILAAGGSTTHKFDPETGLVCSLLSYTSQKPWNFAVAVPKLLQICRIKSAEFCCLRKPSLGWIIQCPTRRFCTAGCGAHRGVGYRAVASAIPTSARYLQALAR